MSLIAIIGAGSWGPAPGLVAGRAGHRVRLWSRNAEVVEAVNVRRVNSVYLDSHEIPQGVTAFGDMLEALDGADLALLAAPSHVTRGLLEQALPALGGEMIFVSATKGIEIETGRRISEVVLDVVGKRFEP